MNIQFDNKVVLVTGASRGIGREIARMFAESGARVAVHYNQDINAAKKPLSELSGNSNLIVKANLCEAEDVKILADRVVSEMGRIDILVNNAGIYEEVPLMEQSFIEWQENWQRTISTNLFGPANLSFCVTRHFKEIGGGKIINISSRGAFRGEPDASAYGASKAGLNSLGQSMARALAPYNIFVYTIAPGYVETDMTAIALVGEKGESIKDQSPLKRVARPDEIARIALFLASEGTEYMTGCVIDVNGASYLRT